MGVYLAAAAMPSAIEIGLAFDLPRKSTQPLWSFANHRWPTMLDWSIDEYFIGAYRSIVSSISNLFYKGKYEAKSVSKELVPLTLAGNYTVKPVKGWWGKGY